MLAGAPKRRWKGVVGPWQHFAAAGKPAVRTKHLTLKETQGTQLLSTQEARKTRRQHVTYTVPFQGRHQLPYRCQFHGSALAATCHMRCLLALLHACRCCVRDALNATWAPCMAPCIAPQGKSIMTGPRPASLERKPTMWHRRVQLTPKKGEGCQQALLN